MTASQIRAFRRRYGFTQQELADATGLTANTIAQLESGKQAISVKSEERLKAFFSFVTLCKETGRL